MPSCNGLLASRKNRGTVCNDGNACTQTDKCVNGNKILYYLDDGLSQDPVPTVIATAVTLGDPDAGSGSLGTLFRGVCLAP